MSGLPNRGFPLVLAAPSGTGKTTLARALVESSESFEFSVSVTTRPPRPGERDGVDYHFVDEPTFEAMLERGELAEWARVHGRHFYGTPASALEAASSRGRYVVLDIDVQGARQIRSSVPDAILVFLLPPSAEALLKRLVGRGTEDHEEVTRRLLTALEELQGAEEFDYVVVNADLEEALDELRLIVAAEGFRPSRVRGFNEEMEGLRAEIGRALDHSKSHHS
ncbi:MAG: guanylate kinase [Gemmatimonadota bacterium]|nr:guanylate kinase [Gemmatimonadota bacterium]MDH5759281.1 guanylate kinase [Gemmatimonadota bacterium]